MRVLGVCVIFNGVYKKTHTHTQIVERNYKYNIVCMRPFEGCADLRVKLCYLGLWSAGKLLRCELLKARTLSARVRERKIFRIMALAIVRSCPPPLSQQ